MRALHALTLIAICCTVPACGAARPLDATSPSVTRRALARAHYERGWSLILDEGRWTGSERAFRAAMAADPDWVLGRTLVARISSDVEEREQLLEWIEARLDEADADSRLLIDLFLLNVRASLARARGETLEPDFHTRRQALALTNFRAYLEQHPEDSYISAELVEWIRAVEGAKAALEAIESEIDPRAARAPFFRSYRATLLSELGRQDEAFAAADAFEQELDDPLAPAPHALRAQLLFDADRLLEATKCIETAVALDGQNQSALALRDRIAERREESASAEEGDS